MTRVASNADAARFDIKCCLSRLFVKRRSSSIEWIQTPHPLLKHCSQWTTRRSYHHVDQLVSERRLAGERDHFFPIFSFFLQTLFNVEPTCSGITLPLTYTPFHTTSILDKLLEKYVACYFPPWRRTLVSTPGWCFTRQPRRARSSPCTSDHQMHCAEQGRTNIR